MDKIKFMKELSSSFSLYEAARWLNKSHEELGGKTPAEFLKENKIEPLYKLLKQHKSK